MIPKPVSWQAFIDLILPVEEFVWFSPINATALQEYIDYLSPEPSYYTPLQGFNWEVEMPDDKFHLYAEYDNQNPRRFSNLLAYRGPSKARRPSLQIFINVVPHAEGSILQGTLRLHREHGLQFIAFGLIVVFFGCAEAIYSGITLGVVNFSKLVTAFGIGALVWGITRISYSSIRADLLRSVQVRLRAREIPHV
jgi:hypothetical protein